MPGHLAAFLHVSQFTWLDVVDVLIVLTQYLQEGLMFITRDNRLLLGVAFVLVVMMGMWLRLMRHPQEA